MPKKPFLFLKNVTLKSLNKVLFENINLTVNFGEQWVVTGKDDMKTSLFLQIFLNKFLKVNGKIGFCFYDEYIKNHKPEDPLFCRLNLIAYVDQKHHFKNLSNTQDFYYQQRYNAHDSEDSPLVKEFLSGIKAPSEVGYWNFERTIKSLGISLLLDEHIIKLSNGETKRLLIAAALLKNPLLLLLDHPYTGLDVSMRKTLNGIIKEIAQSGITIIMATTPQEIPEQISHIAILEHGTLKTQINKKIFEAESLSHESDQIHSYPNFQLLVSSKPHQEFKTIAKLINVVVRYDEKLILNKVNWHIKQGERWSLLGPNGAGKTTLLSLINGDNPQSYANNIVLFDKKRGSGESIWDIKKNIGFMSPELYQYFPNSFTCLKTIESGFYDSIGLYRKSNSHNASIALKWMEMLKISEYSDQLFQEINPNIQRLCLLARALVKNPPLLLLDEPCQGLNQFQKIKFNSLIDKICESNNTTLVYITHYLDEIPSCVTKQLSLEKGTVAFMGAFDAIKK